MSGREYTPRDIGRAVSQETGNQSSANPFQGLNVFREGLRAGFGSESPLFQHICEGIFFALSQASIGHYVTLSDLFDIENFVSQMAKEKPPEIIAIFVHGYVIGLAYLELGCDNMNDARTIAPAAFRLLHAFTSPAGDCNL